MGAIAIIAGITEGDLTMICVAILIMIPVFLSVGAIIQGNKNK